MIEDMEVTSVLEKNVLIRLYCDIAVLGIVLPSKAGIEFLFNKEA